MFKISFTNNTPQVINTKPQNQKTTTTPSPATTTAATPQETKDYSKAIKAYALAAHAIDFESKTEKLLENQLKSAFSSKNADALMESTEKLFPSLTPQTEQPKEINAAADNIEVKSADTKFKLDNAGNIGLVSGDHDINLEAKTTNPMTKDGKLISTQPELNISQKVDAGKKNAIFIDSMEKALPTGIKALTSIDPSGKGITTIIGTRNNDKTTDLAPCFSLALPDDLIKGEGAISIISADKTYTKDSFPKANESDICLNKSKAIIIAKAGAKEAIVIRSTGDHEGNMRIGLNNDSIPQLKVNGREMKEGKGSIVAVKCEIVPISTLSGGVFESIDNQNAEKQTKIMMENLKKK